MIPIYGADGARLPFTYNGLILNSITDVEGNKFGFAITSIAQSSAADFISEKLQWRDGLEVYGVTRSSRMIVMNGYAYAGSIPSLLDRVRVLAAAFDPGRIAFDNGDPFLPLAFSVPTGDTTNFPSGVAPSRIFAMPIEVPIPTVLQAGNGLSARFSVTLLAKDPRRYLQTPETQTGDGTLENPAATYPSYPTLTFAMTGAGASNFTISYTGTKQGSRTLVLDLSGRSNGQAITVDFATRRVLVNGTPTDGIYVSGSWFQIEPGNGNVIAYTNSTGTGTNGSKVMTVYPAFSI